MKMAPLLASTRLYYATPRYSTDTQFASQASFSEEIGTAYIESKTELREVEDKTRTVVETYSEEEGFHVLTELAFVKLSMSSTLFLPRWVEMTTCSERRQLSRYCKTGLWWLEEILLLREGRRV